MARGEIKWTRISGITLQLTQTHRGQQLVFKKRHGSSISAAGQKQEE